ncbi:MAG: hypothetical protein HOM01_10645, partial [Kordiimonadaceae bacterium]|nr:hypothetical protein [Kordiimonadaceae bacterium]
MLSRKDIFPEDILPDANELLSIGKSMARQVTVGDCPFLSHYNVNSEKEYKEQQINQGRIMLHGQIGFRSPIKSQDAYRKIYQYI